MPRSSSTGEYNAQMPLSHQRQTWPGDLILGSSHGLDQAIPLELLSVEIPAVLLALVGLQT